MTLKGSPQSEYDGPGPFKFDLQILVNLPRKDAILWDISTSSLLPRFTHFEYSRLYDVIVCDCVWMSRKARLGRWTSGTAEAKFLHRDCVCIYGLPWLAEAGQFVEGNIIFGLKLTLYGVSPHLHATPLFRSGNRRYFQHISELR